eukprot:m.72715 g.72715  ORF g.72715 m.72715 type:complete len:156 (+) comp16115_c0_seq5:112-579(+)
MPAASKASRSATRVLDIAARERRIRKRIEKLEEDCGQEENFQDVAAAAPFDDDGGNGDGKKSTQGGRSSKKRKRLSASSSRLRRTLDSLITEANLADIDTATPTYLSAAMGIFMNRKHNCTPNELHFFHQQHDLLICIKTAQWISRLLNRRICIR